MKAYSKIHVFDTVLTFVAQEVKLMIIILILASSILAFSGNAWAWGPSIHRNIPHAAVELYTEEPLRSILLRNLEYLYFGANWTDLTNYIGQNYRGSTPPIETYLRPDGAVDQQKLRKALETPPNKYQNVADYCSIDEMMKWNLFHDVGWVDSHTFYTADWWIREIRKALDAGDEHKIAFVCGAYTHSLEIETAFKGSRLPFVPYVGGGVYSIELTRLYQNVYLNSPLGAEERGNPNVFLKKVSQYSYPWDESLSAQEFYKWVLSDEITSLLPEAYRVYDEFCKGPDPALAEPYFSVMYRVLVNSIHLTAHVYNDSLKKEEELARRTGDVLVVQRINGFDAIAPIISFLIQKDISFNLYSGDILPEFDGYKIAIIIEGRAHLNSEEFYASLANYIRAGSPAILIGKSKFADDATPDSYKRLIQLPGLILLESEVVGYRDNRGKQLTPAQQADSVISPQVVAELRRVFGDMRIPGDSLQMPAPLAEIYRQFEMATQKQKSIKNFRELVLEALAKATGKK